VWLKGTRIIDTASCKANSVAHVAITDDHIGEAQQSSQQRYGPVQQSDSKGPMTMQHNSEAYMQGRH
jgi:hypothetical protein